MSFEAGMNQLGGIAINLNRGDTQLSRGEPIEDVARVISRMVDVVMIRTFEQSIIERFAAVSRVPAALALRLNTPLFVGACVRDGTDLVFVGRKVALPALRHRIILNFEGEAEGILSDDIVAACIKEVSVKEKGQAVASDV